ncbi:hypothetical protein AVEN_156072-1 [Araneus ventricosus]|uniref:Ionotropic glutamate receptor L-glutamate and glycine-binding domain-containing protein n=1 Tax=Araneus ventricosus TaxID=182803 RepID=A0A4Y2QGK9_ARAVE|nr:hypothetical protein AVEN_156072-1 [Araneus ventricosus]
MVLNLNKTSNLPLIRVAVVSLKGTMNIITNEDGQITASGMDGLLMDAVLKALGYRYELVIPSDREWGRLEKGNWTGLIGEVVNNRADLAWTWLAPTEERHKVVDFSNIYYSEAITFGVTKPYPIPTAYAIFYPFDLPAWIGVFVIILLMPLLFLIIRARYSYLELFLNIFASILKQPLMISINSGKVLILLISWLLFTLLISCFYSSVLLSFLTKPLIPKVIRNFQELSDVVSKGYLECYASKQSYVLPYLLHSEEEYLKNLGKTIVKNDWNIIDFENAPIKTTKNIAIINSELYFHIKNGMPDSRFLIISHDRLHSSHCSVAMRKDFCCKESLNVMLTRATEAGLFNYYLKRFHFNEMVARSDETEEGKPLTVTDFSGVFILLISGILFSVLTFIVEIAFRNGAHKYLA